MKPRSRQEAEDPGVFKEILRQYKRSWETRNPDLALKLFTPDATYRENPFDSRPLRGLHEIRDYWATVPEFQKSIKFDHGPVFQTVKSNVWASEWRAAYTKTRTGEKIRLKGVLFCELSGKKIRRFWEYWHIRGGSPSFKAGAGPKQGRVECSR